MHCEKMEKCLKNDLWKKMEMFRIGNGVFVMKAY